MADHCTFCDTRRPEGGTNILVLGENWLEFCRPCGEVETLTNGDTGEEATIADVFTRGGQNTLPELTDKELYLVTQERLRRANEKKANEEREAKEKAARAAYMASLKGGIEVSPDNGLGLKGLAMSWEFSS
jgi:hypothetical protein